MRVFNRIVRTAEGVDLARQNNVIEMISNTLETAPPDSNLSQVGV